MDSPPENEPIKKYLNRVAMQLLFSLPREERLKVRQEIRAHLDAMIQGETAQGKPLAEATTAALHRFGDPRKIGRNIRKAWLSKHPVRATRVAPQNWVMLALAACLYFWLIHAFDIRYPNVLDADRQRDPLVAFEHGAVNEITIFSGRLLLVRAIHCRREIQPIPPHLLEMGSNYEERAQTFVDEFGTTMTQAKKDKMRRFQKRVRLFFKMFPIVFYLSLSIVLLFVITSPALSVQSREYWCYQLGEFSSLPAFAYAIGKIDAKQPRPL